MKRRLHHGPFVPLTEASLRRLSTPRLLAYQNRVRCLHETPSYSHDTAYHPRADPGAFIYKSDPLYVAHMTLLRRILDEREHVPRRSSR